MEKHKMDEACRACNSRGLVFYVSRRLPDRDGLGGHDLGLLSCPVCGNEDWAIESVPAFRASGINQ